MEIETIAHLFWECIHGQEFWTSVSRSLQHCQRISDVNFKTIVFGLCHKASNKSIQVINFILFQAKYFIFLSKYRTTIPISGHFQHYLSYRIRIEKEIALIHDKLEISEDKWKIVLEIL